MIVVNLQMSDRDGIAGLTELRALCPAIAVVAMTVRIDDELEATAAGADVCVSKLSTLAELREVVVAAHTGE